jgi:hypothetical protein
LLFAVITYFLFRPQASVYFQRASPRPARMGDKDAADPATPPSRR